MIMTMMMILVMTKIYVFWPQRRVTSLVDDKCYDVTNSLFVNFVKWSMSEEMKWLWMGVG